MRVVLDANVWISALIIPVGASGQLVGEALADRIEVVVTPHLWRETLNSFSKERIQKQLVAKGRLDEAQFILFAARSLLTEGLTRRAGTERRSGHRPSRARGSRTHPSLAKHAGVP